MAEETSAKGVAEEPAAAPPQSFFGRVAASRFRISVQLYSGIGAAVTLTMVASLVAWFAFDRVGDAQRRVNDLVPNMEAAFAVAQQAAALVAAAPRLAGADSRSELGRISDSIALERQQFEANLAAIMGMSMGMDGGEVGDYGRIRERRAALVENIADIENSVSDRLTLAERGQSVLAKLEAAQAELTRVLVPAIDDQLFYTVTGYRRIGEPPARRGEHLSEREIDRYRRMATLLSDTTIAVQILSSAFDLSDKARLDPLKDRFQAAADRVDRSIAALGQSETAAAAGALLSNLRAAGLGPQGGIELRMRELTVGERQRELLAKNRALVEDLVAEVQNLVGLARRNAETATEAANDAILTGRSVLLALNAVSVVGAVLIAWLFVGRVLLRRLDKLSARMRAMAGGDLEAEVDIAGRDEVADMAAALEVFRRHALEVQRLNLVERLAEELRGKNEQLESTLDELSKAQDQIVAREKLAALGELTAGVAHEIRNPLNFVKNFSEASQELLEELSEELEDLREDMDDEQSEVIGEICTDLTDNLERIANHGTRADRIVNDMLKMGRDSGDRQPTDINALLDEHARLAFHSARAVDSDFQLKIDSDLDPDIGAIEVIPQDLGRVFLNMVGNACHATDERRKQESGTGYRPTLRIATKRLAEHVEVRIRDNGSGIPPEVIDKIFNPFFTTKPTDQGTGLGLALSNDIVRQHGGSIRVESEPGSHTEMIIDIPLKPPTDNVETVAAADSAEAPDAADANNAPGTPKAGAGNTEDTA